MARPLPQPTVPLCDPKTGLITQFWYEYFTTQDRRGGPSGGSSSAAWFYGSTAPSNSLGIDGDFYMQLSGGAVVAVRVKQAGVWV